MKKLLAVLLALLMLLAVGCGEQAAPENAGAETFMFTDSVGRQVELPVDIRKAAVSGPLAQIVLFALCPDKLAGVASEWDDVATQYIGEDYLALPELGQLYGGKGELNLETLLASGAQVVVDVGEPKDSVAEDLDALQEQTGIPFVHITATMSTMDEAYRKLGELFGMEQEAEEIAAYCRQVYDRAAAIGDSVSKTDVLYITGENGLNVIAAGSYHAEIIDMLGNNLAVVEEPSSRGTGNEVDMEQLLNWDPDVILFAPESYYAFAAEDESCQQLTAIKNGTYYEAPLGPYNWMGFPPSVQRCLGMMWMAKLLYPEQADYDLYEETAEYFSMFYHCELSEEQYAALVANSVGKQ